MASLGRTGLLRRMWLTQVSSLGQGGQGRQGCHHFANKETEARKVKSLTQNYLAGEWPVQAVSPNFLLSDPQPLSQIHTSKGGADAQGNAEKPRAKGAGDERTRPTPELPILINQVLLVPGQVYPFNSFSPHPISFCGKCCS